MVLYDYYKRVKFLDPVKVGGRIKARIEDTLCIFDSTNFCTKLYVKCGNNCALRLARTESCKPTGIVTLSALCYLHYPEKVSGFLPA